MSKTMKAFDWEGMLTLLQNTIDAQHTATIEIITKLFTILPDKERLVAIKEMQRIVEGL